MAPEFIVPSRMLFWEEKFASEGTGRIAGLDEAGRGPLAGPVVAAAVILPFRRSHPVPIKDSKKLSPARREESFRYLRSLAGAVIGVGVVDQAEIDRINILEATRKAMRSAAALVPQATSLLIDGLSLPGYPLRQHLLIRGEEASVSIAAASIIAKVTRDRIMREYDRKYPGYGFVRHKGYGTREHLAMLDKHGPCPIHRLTFRPVRDRLR